MELYLSLVGVYAALQLSLVANLGKYCLIKYLKKFEICKLHSIDTVDYATSHRSKVGNVELRSHP
jgi:hypothetical protein